MSARSFLQLLLVLPHIRCVAIPSSWHGACSGGSVTDAVLPTTRMRLDENAPIADLYSHCAEKFNMLVVSPSTLPMLVSSLDPTVP
jgi:hypothetical protein